jgi:hypothetical protein
VILGVLWALVLALALCGPGPAEAVDRTNIPLKNWGGFALHRDAIYDDLERLVAAGLADRVILNTRPMTRAEAARIVARAISNIRNDNTGAYNRLDLAPVLDRLMEELDPELRALGVRLPTAPAPAPGGFSLAPGAMPGWLSLTPIDRGQLGFAYSSRDLSLVNSQGKRFQTGFNTWMTFESRAQLGDFLTFYVQPEGVINEEYSSLRLVAGYAKLTLFNVELLVGRDSVAWGPGYRGSLVYSQNAPPLDQIRLGSAEAFMLPWIGEYTGPTRFLAFLAQLEKNRDHPRAKLFGMRGSVTPFTFLELGASFGNMFNGSDPPTLNLSDYPRAIFGATTSDQDLADAKFRNNVVFGVDAELRISNADRFYIPARDFRAYFEYGWDDTCCNTAFIPDLNASSFLFGMQLINLFQEDGLEFRLEFAKSAAKSFTHNQFTSGWWTRGELLSHPVGTKGLDIYGRLAHRFNEAMGGGLSFGYAEFGSPVSSATLSRERRTGGGVDVSWRVWDRTTLFFASQLAYVENKNFRSGKDGVDAILRVELTRTFR